MYFKLYKDKEHHWRGAGHATSPKKIADSGEGYPNRRDCEAGINLVKSTSSSTPVQE